MPTALSENDYNRHPTYFGVYSAAQAARLSDVLESLGVRYEFVPEEQDEERLRAWTAWDPTAANRTRVMSYLFTPTILIRSEPGLWRCILRGSSVRSNQSLQPTATRCAFTFFMTKTVPEIFSPRSR